MPEYSGNSFLLTDSYIDSIVSDLYYSEINTLGLKKGKGHIKRPQPLLILLLVYFLINRCCNIPFSELIRMKYTPGLKLETSIISAVVSKTNSPENW